METVTQPGSFLTLPSEFQFPELVSGFLFLLDFSSKIALSMLATITLSSFILFLTILSLIVNASAIPVDNTRIYGRNLTTFDSNDTQYILRRDASHTTTATQLVVRPKLKLDNDTVILGYMTYVQQRNADEYNKMRTLTTIPVAGPSVYPLGQGAYLEPIMLMSPTDDFDKCVVLVRKQLLEKVSKVGKHADQSCIPTLLNFYGMKAPLLFYKTPGYVKAVIPFEYLRKSPQDKKGTISSTMNPLRIVTVCGPAAWEVEAPQITWHNMGVTAWPCCASHEAQIESETIVRMPRLPAVSFEHQLNKVMISRTVVEKRLFELNGSAVAQ
ncbi:hypothetical protein EV368DRAFT_67799 [Lentinula lateritia]|nr:hypothetical protein EV368DRAFT_67799 [Lentinula lateritia]